MSAKRIVNPDADDLGQGGAELTAEEFETLMTYLGDDHLGGEDAIALARSSGFIVPLVRCADTEEIFKWAQMQADVKILALCREGSFEQMKAYIVSLQRDGEWPEPISD